MRSNAAVFDIKGTSVTNSCLPNYAYTDCGVQFTQSRRHSGVRLATRTTLLGKERIDNS